MGRGVMNSMGPSDSYAGGPLWPVGKMGTPTKNCTSLFLLVVVVVIVILYLSVVFVTL